MSVDGKARLGRGAFYENTDQRSVSQAELDAITKDTLVNAKGYLPKDRLKVVNEFALDKVEEKRKEAEKSDPTFLAKMHGNKPSRGAKIDAELQAEDEEILRRKSGNVAGDHS